MPFADFDRGLVLRLTVQPAARERLIAFGNGDARSLLTTLEFVAGQTPEGRMGRDHRRTPPGYPRCSRNPCAMTNREEHYNLVSATLRVCARFQIRTGHCIGWRECWKGRKSSIHRSPYGDFCVGGCRQCRSPGAAGCQCCRPGRGFVGLPEAQINLAHGTTFGFVPERITHRMWGCRRPVVMLGNMAILACRCTAKCGDLTR